tara:strand:- start:1869 stop:3350 length:1482 start_codon:yes stop_codon:yes gene_type:complete
MERSFPKSIDYQDVLPVAVPAVQRRRKYFPANGTTFGPDGTNEIRIPIHAQNAMLDPVNSYCEFTFTNQSGTGLGLDTGGAHCFFDEVRLEQGGRVLTRIQEYNRLHSGVLSMAQDQFGGRLVQGVTEQNMGLRSAAGGAAGALVPSGPANVGSVYTDQEHTAANAIANGDVVTLTFKPTCGLFTQDKLVPLPLVNTAAPIELVLRLDASVNIGVWGGAPGANAYAINRISYNASLVEVGADVIQQVKLMQEMSGGQLIISGTDIEHTQGDLPANVAGEQPIRCPIRKKSIKSLLFNIQSNDLANGAAGLATEDIFNLSFAGSANMDGYQLKVGSVTYPPQEVRCWGSTAAAGAEFLRGECAMELAKAFGSLGFTSPTGILSTVSYGTTNNATVGAPALADGDNGDGAGPPGNNLVTTSGTVLSACPFGLDLQSFQHTAQESGVDSETMALETTLVLNINAVTSGIEAKNVHMFLLYDQHYLFNMDGSVSFSN